MRNWRVFPQPVSIDEKLVGLKFGKSSNNSVWQKKFGELNQNYEYVSIAITASFTAMTPITAGSSTTISSVPDTQYGY